MVFLGLFSLLLPLLGLVLIAWAVLTIWRTVMLPRNTPREAACEKCKYPVTGLLGAAGFVCPECGSDLLTVGITTPRMEITRRGSLPAALLAWTFLCGGGGYMASFIVLMFVSFSSSMSSVQSATTSWTQTLTPNTNLYQSIELAYESDWQSLASEMDIVLVTSGGTRHTLTLDPGPMTVVGLEGGVAAWDADTIDAWFAEAGLDMTDPQVAAAAAETSRVVDMTIMSPDSGYSLNLSHHTNMAMPTGASAPAFAMGNPLLDNYAIWLVALALGVLVYGVGIVLIVVRRRRLVGRALATP